MYLTEVRSLFVQVEHLSQLPDFSQLEPRWHFFDFLLLLTFAAIASLFLFCGL